jgi:hypothetical protein
MALNGASTFIPSVGMAIPDILECAVVVCRPQARASQCLMILEAPLGVVSCTLQHVGPYGTNEILTNTSKSRWIYSSYIRLA